MTPLKVRITAIDIKRDLERLPHLEVFPNRASVNSFE